jgi:ketosteroid isomerase-like protein
MKKLLHGFTIFLLVASFPAAAIAAPTRARLATPAAKAAPTADEQLFTKLVGDISTAIEKKDMKALNELMASDYTHYNPNGGTSHKADETAFIGTWPPTTIKLMGPVQVNRSGNMAVTVSKHLYSFTENGKATTNTIQHMIVWMQRDGKWQMSLIQSKDVKA